jgi:hypothetical protein
MRCAHEPVATVSLLYAERMVVVEDLFIERDPNLLDLCDEHVSRMTPPVGWVVRDRRATSVAV